MKSNLFFLFGIVLTLVVSGCTGPDSGGTASTGGSVVIQSFSSDETDIMGNDKVTLTIDVANSGDSKATSINAQLLDLSIKTPAGCTAVGCESTDNEWELIKGETPHAIGDLRVISAGEQAIPKQYTWRVQAPKLPANIKQPYQATARISFRYATTAVKQIKLVTLEEYQRLKVRGETLPVTTTQPSNGPLGIDVKVNEPVKIEGGSTTFILVVDITNLANGNAFLGSNPNDAQQWNRANLVLSLPSGLAMVDKGECVSVISREGLNIDLSKGKTFKLACEVGATAPAVSIDKAVTLTATYGYFVDAKLATPITVTGKTTYTTMPAASPPAGAGQISTPPTPGGAGIDNEPPAPVTGLTNTQLVRSPSTSGIFLTAISFLEPSDNRGVTAFEIALQPGSPMPNSDNWGSMPKIAAPQPQGPGRQITVNVQLQETRTYYLAVRAVDAAGNKGPITVITMQTGTY